MLTLEVHSVIWPLTHSWDRTLRSNNQNSLFGQCVSSGIFNSPYHRLFFSPLITNSCKKQLLVSYCLLLWLPLAVYFCSPASHLPLCSKKKKKKILFEFTVCMGHELIPGTCPPLYPCLFNIFRNNTCDWKSQNLPNHVPLLWWLGICNEIMFPNKHIGSCTSR